MDGGICGDHTASAGQVQMKWINSFPEPSAVVDHGSSPANGGYGLRRKTTSFSRTLGALIGLERMRTQVTSCSGGIEKAFLHATTHTGLFDTCDDYGF
jgi:hypothetical protein